MLSFDPTAKAITEATTEEPQQQNSRHIVGKTVSQIKASSKARSGNSIILNGRRVSAAWLIKGSKNSNPDIYINDSSFKKIFGVDLLNTSNWKSQPVQWFSSFSKQQNLPSLVKNGYRYLKVTQFIKQASWKTQVNEQNLIINTPQTSLRNIIQTQISPRKRVILSLNSPTPWEIRQEAPRKRKPRPKPKPKSALEAFILGNKPKKPTPKPPPPNRDWTITLDAIADPRLIEFYTPKPVLTPKPAIPFPQTPGVVINQAPNQAVVIETEEPLIQKVEVVNKRTIIRLSVPFGMAPRITTVPNPNRLVIDIRPDAMFARDIAWAPGIKWKQQFINVEQERFAVKWLEVDPSSPRISIKPIESENQTLVGTAPLVKTAQKYLASAAINGGFFNRKNRLPLGAIRRDGKWLSSPILNRGAIAWDNSGNFYVGRLQLQENLITSNGKQLPVLTLNSGYVQRGVSRYTSAWGSTYTPLTDNEIILAVRNNHVSEQVMGGKAGENPIAIPKNGYLVTFRAFPENEISDFPPGTRIKIVSSTLPNQFSKFPNIMGAGPLLIQDRQIVLDAKAENFSNAFSRQRAIRSGICSTDSGKIIVAAVHNRSGGKGPTLLEHAQLMQNMGCINALNLDGGSSTSIYLGGELINRSANTAARVHNAIGIFLKPLSSRESMK